MCGGVSGCGVFVVGGGEGKVGEAGWVRKGGRAGVNSDVYNRKRV